MASLAETCTGDWSRVQTLRESLVWHPAGAAVPFTLTLSELFRPV